MQVGLLRASPTQTPGAFDLSVSASKSDAESTEAFITHTGAASYYIPINPVIKPRFKAAHKEPMTCARFGNALRRVCGEGGAQAINR